VETLEEAGNEGIAPVGDAVGAKGVDGVAVGQRTGIPDFDAVRVDGDSYFIGVAVVPMTEGINDSLPKSRLGNLRHIDAAHAFETHTDVDVSQNIFLCFVNECREVCDEVVPVDEGGASW
jgi:hypothetical protein